MPSICLLIVVLFAKAKCYSRIKFANELIKFNIFLCIQCKDLRHGEVVCTYLIIVIHIG